MARSFNGTSDGMSAAINLSSFNQITISFWLKWTTFANNDALACEYSTNFGTNTGTFICDPNSASPSGVAYFGIESNGAVAHITTAEFTRPSAGVWHNWICVIDATKNGAAAIPAVYIDGVSQSLTNSNNSSLAVSFGNFTLYFMSRATTSLFGAGSMADFAIWGANSGSGQGALLTAGEASALAKGARPWTIRSPNLVGWWALDGLQSPEPDYSGSAKNGTLTGTASASGPPVMMFTPRWPQVNPATTSSFNPAWTRGRNILSEGFAT